MKPSVFASFAIFIFVGIRTIIQYEFDTDSYVKTILIITIFTSAFYFYYLNVATEQESQPRRRVGKKEVFTWWITALQYTGFLSLWLLLLFNWIWYAFGLLFLNLTYLLWDFLHFDLVSKEKECKIMFLFDIAGVILSALLFWATLTFPPEVITGSGDAHHAMIIMVIGTLLIIQSIFGLITTINLFKYNPFRYFAMDGNPIIKREKGMK